MANKSFGETLIELENARTWHEFATIPEEAMTELAQIAKNLHIALARIAYPANWPRGIDPANAPNPVSIEQWMQSVAADALTNYDRDTYRATVR